MSKTKKAAAKAATEKLEDSRFTELLDSYTDNFRSILLFVQTLSPVILERDKQFKEQSEKRFLECVAKYGIGIEEGKKIKLSKKQLHDLVDELSSAPELPDNHHEILLRGAFVMMIGHFEHIFSELIYCHHKYSTEGLNEKATIRLGELKQYKSIEDAFNSMVIKSYESTTREAKTFREIKDLFLSQYKISLEDSIIDWDVINEARERRHFIVHNNCKVNSKYLGAVNLSKVKDAKEIESKKVVQVDFDYFNSVFDVLFPCGVLIIMNCWGEWLSTEADDAIEELLDISFQYLNREKYAIPLAFGRYAKKINSRNEEQADSLLRIQFNYCLALKLVKDTAGLNKEMNKLKAQNLTPVFKVAYYAIKDDKEKVLQNLKNAKLVDDFKFKNISEWPIFSELRKDPDFVTKAKALLK